MDQMRNAIHRLRKSIKYVEHIKIYCIESLARYTEVIIDVMLLGFIGLVEFTASVEFITSTSAVIFDFMWLDVINVMGLVEFTVVVSHSDSNCCEVSVS